LNQTAPPHLTYLSFFSFWLLAVFLKVLMLYVDAFSHTTESLHYDGWMTLQLRALIKCFAPISVGRVQTAIL